jgi:phage host-nuclease inhibitor protein Gam
MAKNKPDPIELPELPPLRNDHDAAVAVKRVGELMRTMSRCEDAVAADIQNAKLRATEELLPLQAQLDQWTGLLRDYCEANRDRLTDGGRSKTVAFGSGKCAWRHRPPSAKWRGKIELLIERIKEAGLASIFIRTKEEVDKEALAADPDQAAKVGVTVKSAGEDFYVEPAGIELSGAAQ